MFSHFETPQERLVHTQIHVDMIIPEYITRYFHEVITQEKLGVDFEVFGNGNNEDLHWSFVHEKTEEVTFFSNFVYASPTYICQNVCCFTKKKTAEKS